MENTIIIGSGPAGLTAALYAARANMEPLLITGNELGGQIATTTDVENFPGFPSGLTGPELHEAMQQQAEKFGARIEIDEVIDVAFGPGAQVVKTHSKEYVTRTLIIATGASPRKLGVPGFEELAMGAVASGGARVLNEDVLADTEVPWVEVEAVTRREMREIERREAEYRAGRPSLSLQHGVVILVDDGLATGATMRAAIAAARVQEPARLVVAVPTGARETVTALRPLVDDVVTVMTPESFIAVGLWYLDFSPTTDEEVRALLANAAAH